MKTGDQVGWQWGNGLATGTVESVHAERTEIESKGKKITRNGTEDDPAIIIRADNGSKVIKLSHEIQRINDSKDD